LAPSLRLMMSSTLL